MSDYYCIYCKDEGKFYYNNTCNDKCPLKNHLYDSNNICYLCSDGDSDNKYYQKGECVEKCDEGYATINNISDNINDYYCNYCKDIGKFYYNNTCYDKCPLDNHLYDSNNICYLCSERDLDNKYYQKGKCVEKCGEGFITINNIIDRINDYYCYYCKDEKQFYFNNKCYDKCPLETHLIDVNNICYLCSERYTNNTYYQKGECVSECDEGFVTINNISGNINDYYCNSCKDKNNFYYKNACYEKCPLKNHLNDSNNICYLCSELFLDKKYYQNGECVEKCNEGFISIDNIIDNITDYYCFQCKEKGKYYKNNECVDSCDEEGYGENNETYICEYCLNKTNYEFYYNKTCVNECKPFFGWDEKKICTNCSEHNKYFKENKCVPTCGKYIKKNDSFCEACKNDKKYFFEYDCVEECPTYTIQKDDDGFYCTFCYNNYNYYENNCIDSCPKGYAQIQEKIPKTNITVNVCEECGSKNNTWYYGFNCVPKCPTETYASDDHFCRYCFCGFNPNSYCNNISDTCICEKKKIDEIFGNNCEFYSKIKRDNKILSINPIGSIISSKKSYFNFNLSDQIMKSNMNYSFSIKWRVFVEDSEILDIKNLATGINEKIFIINSNILMPGKKNRINLDLNLTDIKNLTNILILNDTLEIAIQSLDQKQPVSIISDSINKVMDNSYILDTRFLIGIEPIKFYYQILIKDEHNEIITLKKKDNLVHLLYKKKYPLSFMLPIFKEFIFELSNNREEKYNISLINNINKNSNMSYSFQEIIEGELEDNYNDTDRIFLIMKYIDKNKEDINYNLLFDFIHQKLIDVSNKNGYFGNQSENNDQIYEVKSNNVTLKTIRYNINYYEPKTDFSLLKIEDIFFNSSIVILKEFLDKITEIKNKKLDNSNILSFFRTLDHLVEIYVNKEKSESKNIINNKSIFDILNKLSEYLISET